MFQIIDMVLKILGIRDVREKTSAHLRSLEGSLRMEALLCNICSDIWIVESMISLRVIFLKEHSADISMIKRFHSKSIGLKVLW